MNNVIEFKSARQLMLEALQDINLFDLFNILQEQRGYGKIVVFAENELGDVEVISENLESTIELLERFYCQNEQRGL